MEPEPTLKEALSGPDGPESQDALDYEIGQLEKLGAWKIVSYMSLCTDNQAWTRQRKD